jgi:hypothetical protein
MRQYCRMPPEKSQSDPYFPICVAAVKCQNAKPGT